ncbi:MAG: hypothetical protein H6718_01840 [Polyangiaceae bacterium]|nr:hypothetical protein [Myxococcales bacterium]MCB9584105.1 hypothetical protein [Polyangiaceae bacterium]
MRPGIGFRAAVQAASWLGMSLVVSGCSSSQLPVVSGSAADPSAAIREEQPPPSALAEDFDPFVAYPELRGGDAEGHQHHMHGGHAVPSSTAQPSSTAAPSSTAQPASSAKPTPETAGSTPDASGHETHSPTPGDAAPAAHGGAK